MAEKKTKLQDAIDVLNEAVENASMVFTGIDKADLPRMLQFYAHVHNAKEDLTSTLKVVNGLHDQLSHDMLPDLMEATEVDSVRQGPRNFVLSVQINASIPKDNPEPGFDWVRNTAKAPGLIVPHINPKQLTSLVTGYFEANAEWPPEQAIRVFKKRHVAVRRK